MSAQDKIAIIEFLREHPNSSAVEIAKGCNLAPKAHSMALYSMKHTGLVIARNLVDQPYPLYSVNPEADAAELENPRLIYNRKRGPQRNHRLGCIEQRILTLLDYEEPRTLQYVADNIGGEVRRAYVSKLLKRLDSIRYVESKGDDYQGPWVKIKEYEGE